MELNRRRIVRSFVIWSTILGLSYVTGCDGRPKRHAVSGRVLIDGEPLSFGIVEIVPEGARASMGPIAEDGSFTMTCYEDEDGVIPGTHRAAVSAGEGLSPTKIKWHAPKKYADWNTSGLTVTIDKKIEDLTIELTWDGGKPFVEKLGRASFEETSDDI